MTAQRIIRPSTPADLETMLGMYAHSRSVMRRSGNPTQWSDRYPSRQLLLEDMARGVSYLIEEDGTAIGTFVLAPGQEPTYADIKEGSWDEPSVPYATLHRVACADGHHGVGDTCLAWCDSQAPSLRVDTHADNRIMQHIVEKWGFVYRGIITVDDGTPRLAYQRLLPTHVCLSLQHYVEHTVLPKYDSFDAAHNRSHALTVITAALAMAQANRVNPNIAYAAAAYHDTGLRHNREQHHLFSGQIIRADHNLRHWFSEQQIEIIAQAAEDHRASATTAPRSIYGCITAEADRHIDPRDIILRTVQYGRSHHPSLDKEGQWERVVHHLQEKYAEGGYLQLWLPDSPNAEGLRRLRAIIADHDALRAAFDEAYLHCLKSQP